MLEAPRTPLPYRHPFSRLIDLFILYLLKAERPPQYALTVEGYKYPMPHTSHDIS